MNKVRKVIIQAIVCIMLLSLIALEYFYLKEVIAQQIEICEDDFTWVYQVDSLEEENGNIVLNGFAFFLEGDAFDRKFELELQELEKGTRHALKMQYIERKDVNEYFKCYYNYINSGFKAVIDTKKIDIQREHYEILLRIIGERKAYQTGIYIIEGQVMYANPSEFVPLEVEGTDLERIVEQGVLRVYRPDYGMYVYQYKNELYWIAEQDYAFEIDGNVYIPYELDTTQINRLPEGRLKEHRYWDDIGFNFCSSELLEWETGKYRVAKRNIPKEYAVEKIWTGYLDNGWVWKEYFRPWYFFE